MNFRAWFKKIVGLGGLLILAVIVIGSGIFFYQCFKPRPVVVDRKAISDSIAHYSDLKTMHSDSAKFFTQKYEEFTIKSDSLDFADSTTLVRMRAGYRADWERKNGY